MLPHLLARVRTDSRYFEPFAGSACLYFALQPRHAVLGDRNAALIGFYRTLRRRPRAVVRCLAAWEPDAQSFYEVRGLDAARLDADERAARFLYLNRLCFNGIYRTNRRGQFNVPYGRRLPQLPSEAQLVHAATVLRRCVLRAGDFEETIADACRGDFVYLDPPYTQNPRAAYGVYGYGGFDAGDLERMLKSLERLDARGVRFLFSYADVPGLPARLSRRWRVDRVCAYAQVAARPAARGSRSELLVTNATAG